MLQNGKISLTHYLVTNYDKEPRGIDSWISWLVFSSAFYEFLMVYVVAYLVLQEVWFSNYEGLNIEVYEANDSKFIENYYVERKDINLQVIGHSSKNYMYSNFVLLWKLWKKFF